MRVFALCLLCVCLCNGALYDLDTLKKKENSIAKDYYIHKLLEQNKLTKKEAQSLNTHIWRYQGKIKKALEALAPRKPKLNPTYAHCFNYTTQSILKADAICQSYRVNFSLYFVSKLDTPTRTKLAQNLKNSNNDAVFVLNAFNQQNPLKYIIDNNNTKLFFSVWQHLNSPDLLIKKEYLDKIISKREFTTFVRNAVIKNTHPKLRLSFLNANAKLASGEGAFYLGINALLFKQEARALLFFDRAYKSYEKQADKDNALFWVYQISKKKEHLQTLAKSDSLNIYSIYARELENKPLTQFATLKARQGKYEFDMKDPFLWQATQRQIQNADKAQLEQLSKDFNATNTLPIYAFIMERRYNFKKNFFIMPYYEHIKDYDKARQALILAIARQESRFIPTAISTSYALGMMQFMPFVANHIARNELKLDKFEQDDMFEPKTAYFFANHHLNYLEEKLSSPVLIAYAYNGGITFTNRMLDKGLFKAGKYEPFLSMELVTYTESRIYAKKVLANYIVYRHLLNDKIKISSIFENLIQSTPPPNTAAPK